MTICNLYESGVRVDLAQFESISSIRGISSLRFFLTHTMSFSMAVADDRNGIVLLSALCVLVPHFLHFRALISSGYRNLPQNPQCKLYSQPADGSALCINSASVSLLYSIQLQYRSELLPPPLRGTMR